MRTTNYKGYQIRTRDTQDGKLKATESIIYDASGNPVGGSFATSLSSLTSEEKAKVKIDGYTSKNITTQR